MYRRASKAYPSAMAWTTSTKRQRGWVGKAEAKAAGRVALRQERREIIRELWERAEPVESVDPMSHIENRRKVLEEQARKVLAEIPPPEKSDFEPLVEWNGLWLPQWRVDQAEAILAEAKERTESVMNEVLVQKPDCGCGQGDGCQWDDYLR